VISLPKNQTVQDPSRRVHLLPSEFVEEAILVREKKKLVNFSFAERPYLRQIYDTGSKRTLLKCGRQVEKSTSLGNKALSYSCLVSGFRTLYVSPTSTQTREFSVDRLKEPVETCPVLGAFTKPALNQNVLSKQFINWSRITLRYAFLSPDRVRGIPADLVLIDEIQDIITDFIPVIEECASHSEDYGIFSYSGTPKSLDNTLEQYWQNLSTQNEWVVPCFRHQQVDKVNNKLLPYWNILGEENIGLEGPICDRCGARIYPDHPDARWASLRTPDLPSPMEGFHISQLMVPWIHKSSEKWNDILHKQATYGRARFFNEVLGEAYDSGIRPLTRDNLESNCAKPADPASYLSHMNMSEEDLAWWEQQKSNLAIFGGIDWGTGENSYTVLTLSTYMGSKFVVFYVHRFTGPEVEPVPQLEKISEIIQRFNVRIVGTDYGGGYDRNDTLLRRFGPKRIVRYQYVGFRGKVCEWDPKQHRYKGNRTEMLSIVFNSIKRGLYVFPYWRVFQAPYAQDLLNIFSEYSDTQRATTYDHAKGTTDDTMHSLVLNLFASIIVHPRPDLLLPLPR
jgi:hypothetical protein